MGHVASMIIRESAGEPQCGQTEESSSVAECGNSVVAILCATNSEFLRDAKICRALYRKTNLCFCAIPSQDYGMKLRLPLDALFLPAPSGAGACHHHHLPTGCSALVPVGVLVTIGCAWADSRQCGRPRHKFAFIPGSSSAVAARTMGSAPPRFGQGMINDRCSLTRIPGSAH